MPPVSSKLSEFQDLLRRLFQVESAQELNFGIYRIINKKAALIQERLIDQMPQIAAAALAKIGSGDRQAAQRNLEGARLKVIETLGEDVFNAKGDIEQQFADLPISKLYSNEQTRARQAGVVHNIENDIYNHLLQFFGRYYQDGDFVPQRRITSRGVYSLPYNGEDVFLHWANRGQYYIKTAEHFHSYSFVANGVKARFVVCEATDTPQNNNKSASRFFFPQIADSVWDDKNKELQIPLQHRAPTKEDNLPPQKKQLPILESACENAKEFFVNKFPKASGLLIENENAESFLFSHLCKYTRRNDSDFFIHKDLAAFLNRELHSEIKNNIINLDEIGGSDGLARAETQMLLARAVQDIGEQIIRPLAQLEEFQKALWEKKKFITQTNYIARLGAVLAGADTKTQAKLCAEICAADKQWNEWKDLGVLQTAKDIFDKDAKKCAAARHDFINKNLSLPLDTVHFDLNFCQIILSCFDNVEEATDGVLIHGENWQALNLLQGKYRGQIKCVYIDPPYNTDSSPILYKNDYKDSSWLSLMGDRLEISRMLMAQDSISVVAIDDQELRYLTHLLDIIFGQENYIGTITTLCNPQGRVAEKMSPISEYHILHAKNNESFSQLRVPKFANNGNGDNGVPLKRTGTNSRRENRPLRFYPILLKDEILSMITRAEYEKIYDRNAEIFNESFINDLKEKYTKQGFDFILPINRQEEFLVWQREFDRVEREIKTYKVRNGTIYTPSFEEEVPKSLWKDSTVANPEYGSEYVKDILGEKVSDNTAKSIYTVMRMCSANNPDMILDYFAGSGTTAHAVMKLNREDGGRRKFILVEMGDYFDDVLMKRIKKIIYTPNWKDGKPSDETVVELLTAHADSAPRLIKYHCMESYEDALDNIEFKGDETLFDIDYKSRYMLQWESKESATFAPGGKLDSPFGYTLKRAGKRKNAVADLPETFNYMAGIRLHSRRIEKNGKTHYQIDIGDYGDEEAAFIWRDIADWKESDYEKEYDFIKGLEYLGGKKIYTNGDSKIRGAKSLSPIFAKLMFTETE